MITVAIGADSPLAEDKLMADYFHGRDGLGGIYNTHPHLSPADTWKSLFKLDKSVNAEEREMADELKTSHETLFTPSKVPSHEEILRLLRENEPDTFTIVAVGPLTNLALAAAADPETFLRVKEVVVMGGAIDVAGNVSYGAASSLHDSHDFPHPPFKLIKQYPSPLRAALNIRNQITPVAGVPAPLHSLNEFTNIAQNSTPTPTLSPQPACMPSHPATLARPCHLLSRCLRTKSPIRPTSCPTHPSSHAPSISPSSPLT